MHYQLTLLLLADTQADAILYLTNTQMPKQFDKVVIATNESAIRGVTADFYRATETIQTRPRYASMEESAKIATMPAHELNQPGTYHWPEPDRYDENY